MGKICDACGLDESQECRIPDDPECREKLRAAGPVNLDAAIGSAVASLAAPAVGDVSSDALGSGARYNAGKSPLEYVPLHLLEGAAKVFQQATVRSVNPYPAWNWAKGMRWSVPYACALRHLAAYYRGEDSDIDSGELHIDHAICNLLMLKHYYAAFPEGDDRPNEFADERLRQHELKL